MNSGLKKSMETLPFKHSTLAMLIIATTLSLVSAACATTTRQPEDPHQERLQSPPNTQLEPSKEAPKPPPLLPPPPLVEESWELPSFEQEAQPFPFLLDEETSLSRSIGQVTTGSLVNGRPLPSPHPHMAILPRQFARRLQYTSQAMIDLLEDATDHLTEAYPEAVLYLGNLGRPHGGNIPYSVSHTNGRDADLAFFVLDKEGQPTTPPDLLPLDKEGIFDSASFDGELIDEDPATDLFLRFDAPRNWRLIEGLIHSKAAHIQYIFVSNPLRRLLLEEGRRQGASASTMRKARQLLVQPGGALPHDDHFHLRIHCSPQDLASGCQERGRPGPTFRPDPTILDQTIAAAAELLHSDHPYWRQIGLRRLTLIEDHNHHDQVRQALQDSEPTVRVAAIRALDTDPLATPALINALQGEENPHVFAELIVALSHRGSQALEPLIDALNQELLIHRGPAGTTSTLSITALALARQERPEPVPHLIDALAKASPQTRAQINYALQMLTNHQLPDQSPQSWDKWWQEHQDLDRDQWLAMGFQAAGFQVQDITPDAVWELCRAITSQPHLNFNAQRSLMRLSGRTPSSLTWHPHDASFYWRRYFEERQTRLPIPPIPQELSTADGYTKPEG